MSAEFENALSLAARTDARFTDQAFDSYRREHGISDGRRLGDMPLKVISEVLDAAQRLKTQEANRGTTV
jgi:hypothetical protein